MRVAWECLHGLAQDLGFLLDMNQVWVGERSRDSLASNSFTAPQIPWEARCTTLRHKPRFYNVFYQFHILYVHRKASMSNPEIVPLL